MCFRKTLFANFSRQPPVEPLPQLQAPRSVRLPTADTNDLDLDLHIEALPSPMQHVSDVDYDDIQPHASPSRTVIVPNVASHYGA